MNKNNTLLRKMVSSSPHAPGNHWPKFSLWSLTPQPDTLYKILIIYISTSTFEADDQCLERQLPTFTFPPKLSRSLVGTSHWSPWCHLFDHSEETPWKDGIKLPIGSTHGMFAYIHFSFRSIKVCDLCRHATLPTFTKNKSTFHVGKYTINGSVMGFFHRLKTSLQWPRLSACSS